MRLFLVLPHVSQTGPFACIPLKGKKGSGCRCHVSEVNSGTSGADFVKVFVNIQKI